MPGRIASVRCTQIVAQVNIGFYDEEGNLVGEETYPQSEGMVIAARLFHPHSEQLASLIHACIQQALAKLDAQSPGVEPRTETEDSRIVPGDP